MTVVFLTKLNHCDQRFETEFLTENKNELGFSCAQIHVGRPFFFDLSSSIYSALYSNCNKISDTISIIYEIYIQMVYNCCSPLVCGSRAQQILLGALTFSVIGMLYLTLWILALQSSPAAQ